LAGLYEQLQRKGVKLSLRHGRLRFSLHLSNTEQDVDQVLRLIAGCLPA